jgi:hypothetical protein
MYPYDNLSDFFTGAFEKGGLLPIDEFDLKFNSRKFDLPLNSDVQRANFFRDCIEFEYWATWLYHPLSYSLEYLQDDIIDEANSLYLKNCFVIKDGKHYLDVFSMLQIEDRNIEFLKDFSDLFISMRHSILKMRDVRQLHFYMQHHTDPDRLSLEINDESDNDNDYSSIEKNMNKSPHIKQWMNKTATSISRVKKVCWINLGYKQLISEEESFLCFTNIKLLKS